MPDRPHPTLRLSADLAVGFVAFAAVWTVPMIGVWGAGVLVTVAAIHFCANLRARFDRCQHGRQGFGEGEIIVHSGDVSI